MEFASEGVRRTPSLHHSTDLPSRPNPLQSRTLSTTSQANSRATRSFLGLRQRTTNSGIADVDSPSEQGISGGVVRDLDHHVLGFGLRRSCSLWLHAFALVWGQFQNHQHVTFLVRDVQRNRFTEFNLIDKAANGLVLTGLHRHLLTH